VGGTAIAQDQFLALLIRSRGVPVLEQFVGLAAAEEHARQRGLSVSQADIQFEYDLSLRRLSDPLASPTGEGFDQAEAERQLESILATRQMSRPEYLLSVRRNACLRKILAAEQRPITDEQLRDEFVLAYGERIQLRHIQIGNLSDAARIKERLAFGEDFAELAARYSTNAGSARRGGLLDPFSLRDDSVALAMREAAARLTIGETSDVMRIGEWYHVILLEKLVPPSQRSLDSVREPLRKRIEVRMTDPHMRELHERLFTRAALQIHDPALREAYQAVHGQR
jgi:foldase protein PrsA